MKAMKKLLSLLLVGVMLFGMVACSQNPQQNPTTVPNDTKPPVSSDKATYTVKLTTAGGMALGGYQVMIYKDAACTDIETMGTTDQNGNVPFSLKKDTKYYIKLDNNTLKGYDLQPYYEFNGTTANITLTSSLIQGESVTSATAATTATSTTRKQPASNGKGGDTPKPFPWLIVGILAALLMGGGVVLCFYLRERTPRA